MNNHKKEGYLDGYMAKEAILGLSFSNPGKTEATSRIKPGSSSADVAAARAGNVGQYKGQQAALKRGGLLNKLPGFTEGAAGATGDVAEMAHKKQKELEMKALKWGGGGLALAAGAPMIMMMMQNRQRQAQMAAMQNQMANMGGQQQQQQPQYAQPLRPSWQT